MPTVDQAESPSLRQIALNQAAHDCRGAQSAQDVVKRAEVYLDFIGGKSAAFPTEAQIKHMVERFLGWRLPADFKPDAGISFKAEFNFNENTGHPMRHEPMGTNLFDATQAAAMIRHMLADLPAA